MTFQILSHYLRTLGHGQRILCCKCHERHVYGDTSAWFWSCYDFPSTLFSALLYTAVDHVWGDARVRQHALLVFFIFSHWHIYTHTYTYMYIYVNIYTKMTTRARMTMLVSTCTCMGSSSPGNAAERAYDESVRTVAISLSHNKRRRDELVCHIHEYTYMNIRIYSHTCLRRH